MWRTIVLVTLLGVNSQSTQCRVLAIGGGTEMGAYEAGVIIGLINNLPAGEAQWDVVTGIGMGAVNAMIVGEYAKGQEALAAVKLSGFWGNFTYSQVYNDWVGGLITGLLEESGLYNSAPLKKTLTKLAPSALARWVNVGASDLISGNYVAFNSTGQSLANMITGALASASEPGILPFVNYNKLQLVSGVLNFGIDILHGVNGCAKLGFSPSQTVIHAVMGAGRSLGTAGAAKFNTIQAALRYAEIAAFELFEDAIENAGLDFPGVQIPYVIYPTQHLNRTLTPYDYTPSELAEQLAVGQQDAKNAVSKQMPFMRRARK